MPSGGYVLKNDDGSVDMFGKIHNVSDPTDMQDAMTLNHAMNFGATLPITWVSGVQKTNVKQYCATGTVSGGNVTFQLTTNGLSTGTAIFTNVYIQSRNLWVDDIANAYVFGNYTFAADKKSVTFAVRRLNVTSSAGLINLLGGALAFLTGIVFTAPADGTTVYLQIKGD